MKLNKTENAAFAAIGAALCEANDAKKLKKDNLPLVASAIAENKAEFMEGVTIGDYRFKLIVRPELTAIRV